LPKRDHFTAVKPFRNLVGVNHGKDPDKSGTDPNGRDKQANGENQR
jgi:hypothetical protein